MSLKSPEGERCGRLGKQAPRRAVLTRSAGVLACPFWSSGQGVRWRSDAAAGADSPANGDQDAGPHEGDRDTPPEADIAMDEEAEQEAAHQGSDQAQDNVHDDPVAAAPHGQS